ncbi:hypothetical protein QBZ16_004250 [Prototheca wickerhamii]|uniref:SERRATE/Ars2 C-terminal domain-containing protein n=1 Tax=Prototheca wickerhamii TaxID=3111 RepID=A0AAD9IIT4_PROWI|nr:hypothetical protein QBZ16_004250 [Prototheca wickerhamii]
MSLDDTVGVEEAGHRYKQYLSEFWGGAVKAEFEDRRGEPAVRQRFDPRELRRALEDRDAAARAAAERFASEAPSPEAVRELGPGPSTDPAPLGPEEEVPLPQPSAVPAAAAEPDRVREDLKLALELVAHVDKEKGIEGGAFQSKGREADGAGAAPEVEARADADAQAEPSAAAEADGAAPEPPRAASAEPEAPALSPEEALAELDRALAYLWAVHAIDFYGARELSTACEAARREARLTWRRAAAEDAESEPQEGADAAALGRVTEHWRARLARGDAGRASLQSTRVEEGLERFIDGAIIRHDDNKWGNRLSAKLFVAREFVVKHIRNKHGHVLEAEREKIEDEIFFENFKAWRDARKRPSHGQDREGGGGRGRGGRARRGGGRFGGGEMVFDPASMMGPVMLPPQGAGAPPAGMMPPVIMAPMDLVMGGGRGGGRGRGGRDGFVPAPGPIFLAPGKPRGQEYFDLDAPQNNRAVLDYGDL